MPLYLVDTIVTYRIKYAIEAKELSHAYDEVVCHDGNIPEVTQLCLGEQIIDGREITMDELNALIEKLKTDRHEMSSHWMGEKLVHKINYENL